MIKKIQIQALVTPIFMVVLLLFGCMSRVQNNQCNQENIMNINDYYTKTNFRDFKVTNAKSDIHPDIASDKISIFHNDSFHAGVKQKFVIEYNIGSANFSDFDISVELDYNVTLASLWGEIGLIIGSDIRPPDDFYAPESKLCSVKIQDYGSEEGGRYCISTHLDQYNPDDYLVEAGDLSTPDEVIFHMNRTGENIVCEIIKDSTIVHSHTWSEEIYTFCNFLRIQLDYYSEVEEFSYEFSNLNAQLDVSGEIIEGDISSTSTGYSFYLPSIGFLVTTSILSLFFIFIKIRRRKNSYNVSTIT